MILISEEPSRAGPGRARRPGSAGPRLGGGGGGSRCSSWDRSLHREDWKHGSIGKLDPKEGESDLMMMTNSRRKRPASHAGISNSFLSSDTSIPHYAAHTAASSARISRSVDRYQGEAFASFFRLFFFGELGAIVFLIFSTPYSIVRKNLFKILPLLPL